MSGIKAHIDSINEKQLLESRHPEDKRLVRTPNVFHFMAAANSETSYRYQGAIWQPNISGQRITQSACREIFNDNAESQNFTVKFTNRHKRLTIADMDPALESLHDYLLLVGQRYQYMSDGKVASMKLTNCFKDHTKRFYPAMIATLLGQGRSWKNKEGKILQLAEGELLYHKEIFISNLLPVEKTGDVTLFVEPRNFL
jgi:hypothetical protein